MVASNPPSPEPKRLERSIGLGRVLFQSVAAMGPGASVALGLGLIILYSTKAAPLAMLLGAVAALCIATAVGQLATRMPSAGGFSAYAARTFGTGPGFLVGWLYAILYLLLAALSSLNFSIIGRDFCTTYLHFTPPSWLLGVLVVGAALAATWRGVRASTGVTMVLGIAEVAILLLVSILLMIHAGAANTLSVFSPSNASGGGSGLRSLFLGVVFALAAVAAFDAAVPMAEEARNPRRTVPRAVVYSALLIGLFYVLATYTAVVAWGPDKLQGYLESPNPWREMAHQLGGFFSFLVVLALLNSVVAGTQAGFNGTTRVLYAMSRTGMFPRALARLHPRYRSPYVAAAVTTVLALAGMAITSVLFDGAFGGFIFFLTVSSIIFIALYIVMAVTCWVFFLTRRREELNVWLHLAVPLLGVVVLVPALYYSVKDLTSPASWAVPAVVVWFALGLVVLVLLKVRGTDLTAGLRRLAETSDDELVAEPPA
jgi:amino acid transporter